MHWICARTLVCMRARALTQRLILGLFATYKAVIFLRLCTRRLCVRVVRAHAVCVSGIFARACAQCTKLFELLTIITTFFSRPQVERQYPPNLSILISGGKETNRDSLSSGERSGRSPSSESGRAPSPCPELWSHGKASLSAVAGRAKVPWKRAPGRVTAPSIGPTRSSRLDRAVALAPESGCLGMQP